MGVETTMMEKVRMRMSCDVPVRMNNSSVYYKRGTDAKMINKDGSEYPTVVESDFPAAI